MQVVTRIRRHHHLDADQPVQLRPGDQPAGRRSRYAQTGSDLGLRQPIQVVEDGRAQGQPQIFR
jgi:hypothetical protein